MYSLHACMLQFLEGGLSGLPGPVVVMGTISKLELCIPASLLLIWQQVEPGKTVQLQGTMSSHGGNSWIIWSTYSARISYTWNVAG